MQAFLIGLIVLAFLTIVLALRAGSRRGRSIARVDALQALVAEAATAGVTPPLTEHHPPLADSSSPPLTDTYPPLTVSPAPLTDTHPPLTLARTPVTDPDDDWDLRLRDEEEDVEERPAAPVAPIPAVAAQRAPVATAARVAASTNQFVVEVPDGAVSGRYHVSFQRGSRA